uniref:UPF0235 protein ENT43_00945 n=1 Tax=candidate division CPR3 bacterium TaxID=2268181 RepID=A0A7C4M1H2_UNCC3
MKLNIKITPNAKKTEIVGEDITLFGDKVLKIKVATPPVEGKANKELIDFLSSHFKVSKSSIKIMVGDKSRNKIIEIK